MRGMLKYCLLGFLFCLGINWMSAQETISFEEGTFDIVYKGTVSGSDGAVVVSPSGGVLELDYKGIDKPSVLVYLQNVQWKEGIEDHSLVFKSGWLSSPSGLKKVTNRNITLKRSSVKKKCIYEPLKNGEFTITIKYAVLKPGESEESLSAGANVISQTLKITGLEETETTTTTSTDPTTKPPVINETKTPDPPTTNNTNGESGWPIGWQGNTFSVGAGRLSVSLETNIPDSGGGMRSFSMQGSSNLDFTGVANPQIWIVLRNARWKDPSKQSKIVVKSGWVEILTPMLEKVSFGNIEYTGGAAKRIPIKVKGNGPSSIILKLGHGDISSSIGSIPPIAAAITKSLSIIGVGDNSTAATNPNGITPPPQNLNAEANDTKDLEFWNTVKTENTFESYLRYWEQAKEGKFRNECYREIVKTPIRWQFADEVEIPDGGKLYTINIAGVRNIYLDSLEQGLTAEILPGKQIHATIIDGKSHTIKVIDDFKRSVEIQLDPASKILRADFSEEEGIIKFDIKGGKPPYYLSVIDAVSERRICDLGRANLETNSISRKEIYERCNQLEGKYRIKVQDGRRTENVSSTQEFKLKSAAEAGFLSYLWIILIVLLIPIGIVIKKNL